MNLVYLLKEIEKNEIKLDEIYNSARVIEKEIKAMKKELQDNYEHPEQFRDKVIHKGYDPLEADSFDIYCHICEKRLGKGTL
jgi:Ni,Fe-hydrogenase III large subunit